MKARRFIAKNGGHKHVNEYADVIMVGHYDWLLAYPTCRVGRRWGVRGGLHKLCMITESLRSSSSFIEIESIHINVMFEVFVKIFDSGSIRPFPSDRYIQGQYRNLYTAHTLVIFHFSMAVANANS